MLYGKILIRVILFIRLINMLVELVLEIFKIYYIIVERLGCIIEINFRDIVWLIYSYILRDYYFLGRGEKL